MGNCYGNDKFEERGIRGILEQGEEEKNKEDDKINQNKRKGKHKRTFAGEAGLIQLQKFNENRKAD